MVNHTLVYIQYTGLVKLFVLYSLFYLMLIILKMHVFTLVLRAMNSG